MKKALLPLVALLAVVTACKGAEPSDLSTQFRETPFRHLRGVELGMTGRRLHAIRPASTFAPYLGLQERIPGFMVSYQFPLSMEDGPGSDVRENDTLEGVFITEPFVSLEAAEARWHAMVRELSSSRRAPDTCEKFPTGGMQARWFSGKVALAVGVFPREAIAPTVGDRVIYAVAPMATMKQPAGGQTIACPNS